MPRPEVALFWTPSCADLCKTGSEDPHDNASSSFSTSSVIYHIVIFASETPSTGIIACNYSIPTVASFDAAGVVVPLTLTA